MRIGVNIYPNHVNQQGEKTNKRGWNAIKKVPFHFPIGVTLDRRSKAGKKLRRKMRRTPSLTVHRINLIHWLLISIAFKFIIDPMKILPRPIAK